MSLTYWPNAEYTQADNNIKRLRSSTPFPSFSAALSKLNSWNNDVNILWAWIDIKDGNKKVEKVKLSKDSDGLWSGEATVSPEQSETTSAGEPPFDAASTIEAPTGGASVDTESSGDTPAPASEELVPDSKKSPRRYNTATKLAMVARIKAEGIMHVSKETGISAVSLRSWKRQVGDGKLVPTPSISVATPEQAPVDAPELSPVHAPEQTPVDAPEQNAAEASEERVDVPVERVKAAIEAVEPLQLSFIGDEPVSIRKPTKKKYSFEAKLTALSRAKDQQQGQQLPMVHNDSSPVHSHAPKQAWSTMFYSIIMDSFANSKHRGELFAYASGRYMLLTAAGRRLSPVYFKI